MFISQLQQELVFQDMKYNDQEEEMKNAIAQEEAKLQKSKGVQARAQEELEQIHQEIKLIQEEYEKKGQIYKTISGGVDISQLDKDIFDQNTLIEDFKKQLTKLSNENQLLTVVV